MNLLTPAAGCAALFLASTLFSHTVALRLILLIAGVFLLLAALAKERLQGEKLGIEYLPPLVIPFALWAAWAALSAFWTLDAEITRKEFRNEIVYAFGAFWLCFVAAQSPRAPRVVAISLATGATAVCAAALAEALFAHLGEMPVYGGPGAFSATILVLYPCTLACAWLAVAQRQHPAWIALLMLLVPLYVVAGYVTQNRTLWVGVAVETALLALLLLLRPMSSGIRKVRVAVIAILLVAGAGVMLANVQSVRTAASPEAVTDSRPDLWRAVLRRVEDRPLTGYGFGRGMARHELRDEIGNRNLWHSHNLFLDTAFQLGWPGLALLLLLFGWTVALGWRLARSANDVAFACGLALLPVVAGTLVRNMTDVLWVRNSALFYWGVVGVLLAWGLHARATAPPR